MAESKRRKEKEGSPGRKKTKAVCENNDDILYGDHNQRERYEKFAQRGFGHTRFMHDDTLETLGLKGHVYRLLNNIYLLFFPLKRRPTYRRITLEVLRSCSLRYDIEQDEDLFHFRFLDIDYVITIDEFSNCFEMINEGDENLLEDFTGSHLWSDIRAYTPSDRAEIEHNLLLGIYDSRSVYSASWSKSSLMYNSTFRYVLRILTCGLLGRGDSGGNFGIIDNFFIECMIYSKKINCVYFLTEHLEKVGRSSGGLIIVGGLVTMLVEGKGIYYLDDNPPVERDIAFINLQHYVSGYLIKMVMHSYYLFYHETPIYMLLMRTSTTLMIRSTGSMTTLTLPR